MLFLLLPLLGLLYSAHPVRLKRYFILAVLTTSTILIIPILLGYYMNASGTSNLSFFVALFIFCLAVIPLKDIEDIKGDTQHRCQNWYDKLGENRLLSFSLGGLIFDLFLVFLLNMNVLLKVCSAIFISSAMLTIVAFASSRKNISKLYRTIISIVVVEGAIFLALICD
jgi:4-hydroxybenzoate polyprenyltransferase/geranylgeranylglycerol-phosphate geranylgeranyltransferase